MVSFWPFRSGDTTAAGFEKILSSLSTKITAASAKDARLRSQQRRIRVLWTLYTSFAYLIACLILLLVVKPRNWTLLEHTSVFLSPFVIYAVRLTIDAVYNYRLARTSAVLEDLQAQRAEAIAKLKAATKYDSTQQLLDKYGGEKPRPKSPAKKEKPQPKPAPKRTGLPPPPTANIVLPPSPQQHSPRQPAQHISPPTSPPRDLQAQQDPSAIFAPNAFSPPPPSEPRWYDRVLDAILGEDETHPKNRLVLLCKTCRLVNGQAPPGTRSLEELGEWRCMACGSMNGTASATKAALEAEASSPVHTTDDAKTPAKEHEEHEDDDETTEDPMEDVRLTSTEGSTALEDRGTRRRK